MKSIGKTWTPIETTGEQLKRNETWKLYAELGGFGNHVSAVDFQKNNSVIGKYPLGQLHAISGKFLLTFLVGVTVIRE